MFGCAAYLDSEGRGVDGKDYVVLDIARSPKVTDCLMRKLGRSSDVTFNESKFDHSKLKSETVKCVIVDLESETSEKEWEQLRDESQEEPRRSERECRPPNRCGFSEYADTAKFDHLAYNACQANRGTKHHRSQ